MAARMKTLARCLEETGMSLEALVNESGLEAKDVKAIVAGNYTPSPSQRKRLARLLSEFPPTRLIGDIL